jgi:hypothetical protein
MDIMRTYEALLADQQSVKQVEAARREVEQAGGRLRVYPPNKSGLTLVELTLPAPLRPTTLFPGLPFTLI